MTEQTLITEAAHLVASAQIVAVSSGAGISKESGVPTFRDAQDGLWSQYSPEQLATPQAFRRDRDLVWSWYQYRTQMVTEVEPNLGHYAVASLEDSVPQVVVLTQNIDGLHARAGSTDIVEVHGRLGRYKCFANCQGLPTIVDIETVAQDGQHAPQCPHCTDYLRPDVTWYGEALPVGALERAISVAESCDVMLVVGTSGTVQPAASLPVVAKQHGATLIEINPVPSMLSSEMDIFLQGPSGEILPALLESVRSLNGLESAQ